VSDRRYMAVRVGIALVYLALAQAATADWTNCRGDADRTGVSAEQLRLPLGLAWAYQADHPPSPAFRGGTREPTMTESITFDYAFHTVIADGRLYFGSSTEEAVFCLDAATGETQWVRHVDGAVRVAPTLWRGKVYFGSDDGRAYCLDGATGETVWTFRAAPGARRCIGNERIVSAWPVRTGVTVVEGTAYFAAGLLPPLGVHLYAADAETGETLWHREIPYAPHGQILVEDDVLFVPTGRTSPAEFRRADGEPLVSNPPMRRAGGSDFIGKMHDMLVFGPSELGILNVRVSRDPMPMRERDRAMGIAGSVTSLRGRAMLAGDLIYLLRDDEILAFDEAAFRAAATESCGHAAERAASWHTRYLHAQTHIVGKEDVVLFRELRKGAAWSAPGPSGACSMIIAGRALLAGGDARVVALDAATGRELWSTPVQGRAYGLAVSDGSLFVSTDRGIIYCFRPAPTGRVRERVPSFEDPYQPDAACVEAAQTALEHADTHRGYCLILGIGDGALAREIARRSEFFIVALDRDPAQVRAARDRLTRAGLYGSRVVVYHCAEDEPPYADYFANLLVSEECLETGRVPYAPAAALRMLQPCGGAVVLGGHPGPVDVGRWQANGMSGWQSEQGACGIVWKSARRGALPGAGQWTHIYADPGNTGCSGDRLVNPDLCLQWFGPPGADDVVDRHAIAMPPLFDDGKLFIAGLHNTLRAVDAYNGTTLWKIDVPDSVRMLITHNAGFVCVGGGHAFVASGNSCWMVDADTGQKQHAFVGADPSSDWGYVATAGDHLLGANQRPAASKLAAQGLKGLVNASENVSRPIAGQNVFAFDYRTRRSEWTYRGGTILNPTIAVGADTVFLAESVNPAALDEASGTADMGEFFASGAAIVALDLGSGRERWRKPLLPKTDEAQWLMYLSFSDNVLLSTRTYWLDDHLTYELNAMSARTGEDLWVDTVQSPNVGPYAPLINGKNAAAAHPDIAEGRAYWLAHTFGTLYCHDLLTGAADHHADFGTGWQNKGCASPSASSSYLFYRSTSSYAYEIASRRKIDMTRVVRPGCWMSIIPAGGLVLMPEASSGCTCGFALQTSLALAPRGKG